MNGRVYDPELGRFMSADPFVQAPYNSQSYNRYSYVFNNPLSYTDPSGFVAMSMISYIYADYGGRRGPESDSRPPEETRTVGVPPDCAAGASCLTGEAAYQFGQDWQSQMDRMINHAINDAINLANRNEAIADLELLARHQAVLGLDNSGTLKQLESLTLDDIAALTGGVDQMVGATGIYLTDRIRKGQESIIRSNLWKGFNYQSGLQKSVQIAGGFSRVLFVAGTGLALTQGWKAYQSNDGLGVFKSGVDISAGVAAATGSIGFVDGASYYGASTLLQYSETARYILVDKPVDMTLWLYQKTGICTGCY